MAEIKTPLIKGMFINSHVKALKAARGEAGLKELTRRYGKPLNFKNLEDVPVQEEVAILNLAFELLSGEPVDPAVLDFEAGRLHFRNFSNTPFAKILMGAVPRTSSGFKTMLGNSGYIASHVFKHMRFGSEPSEGTRLISRIENCDYPLRHFSGLFYEWMCYWGLPDAQVEERELEPCHYRYEMLWKEHDGA